MISNSTRQEPSATLFRKSKILSVYSVNTLLTCVFMFKFIYHRQNFPDTFHNFFLLLSDIHSSSMRQSKDFHLPYCRTSNRYFFIIFRGPRLWNSLNTTVKSSSSLITFKTIFKNILYLNRILCDWVCITPLAHLKCSNFCFDYFFFSFFFSCFFAIHVFFV